MNVKSKALVFSWVLLDVAMLTAGCVSSPEYRKIGITPSYGCYMGAFLSGISWPELYKLTQKKFAIHMLFRPVSLFF